MVYILHCFCVYQIIIDFTKALDCKGCMLVSEYIDFNTIRYQTINYYRAKGRNRSFANIHIHHVPTELMNIINMFPAERQIAFL